MVLSKIAKILSKDELLIRDKIKLIDILGIPGGNVDSLVKIYDLRHCSAYDLMRDILIEWVKLQGNSATLKELIRILKEEDFFRIADQLQKLEDAQPGPSKIAIPVSTKNEEPKAHSSCNPPPEEIKSEPIVFGVKKVVLNFMGRQDELKKINEHFDSGECKVVLISGLGGIGKTELAKKFALTISDLNGSTQIVISWLSGETPQTLLNSCTKFCLHLGLTATDAEGKPLQMEAMLQNILAKMNSSRWLVIIDNVDEIHAEFENAVRILCGFGSDVFILVTSRRRDIFPGELEFLEVAPLQPEDSVQFVKKSLGIENTSQDAIKSLCLQLGNFPLALGQAVAFIKQQQSTTLKGRAYGIQNYLDELTKTQTLGLDKDRNLSEYSTATLKVWNITLDKILDVYGAEGKTALDLLDVIAFINPDNIRIQSLVKLFNRFYSSIELQLLQFLTDIYRFYTQYAPPEVSDQSHSRSKIEICLQILLKYSLISSFDDVVSIHRLVQLSLRDRMTSNRKYIEMLTAFWSSFDKDEWNQEEMPHILTIWNHSKPHPDVHGHRANKTRFVYYQLRDLGMVNESYNFVSEGCKFLLDLCGSDDLQYLVMEQALAMAMKDKGQYQESLEKLTFVHEQFTKLCGEDTPSTSTTMYNIAHVLHELERFEDCLEWGQRALQSQIRIYGENNSNIIRTKNVLGLTLLKLGRGMEALKMLYETCKWNDLNLGKNHPSTLSTRHNFAICLFEGGLYAEALGVFKDLVSIQEEHRGSDHPITLQTKAWVANSLFMMGEKGKLLELWEDLLTTKEKVLGSQHPHTVLAREWVTFLKKTDL